MLIIESASQGSPKIMKHLSIMVRAEWDDDASVWVATSHDVDGLCVEAATMESLTKKIHAAIQDLLELNGTDSSLPEIPVQIMSAQLSLIPNPCH